MLISISNKKIIKMTGKNITFRGSAKLDLALLFICLSLPYVFVEPALVDVFLMLLVGYLATKIVPNSKAFAIMLLYWLGTVVSVLAGSYGAYYDPQVIWRYVAIEILISMAFIYIYTLASGYNIAHKFVRYYVIGAICSCLMVLALLELGMLSDVLYRDDFRLRVKGFFKDPNVLGPYLVLPIVAILFSRKLIKLPMISFFLIAPLAYLLFVTYSRGAYVLLVVSVVTCGSLIMIVERKNNTFKIIPLILGILILIYVLANYFEALSFSDDYSKRLAIQDYDSDRLFHIINGLKLLATNPFGIGPGLYGLQYYTNPHNLFVGKLVDSGIVSAIIISVLPIVATLCALKYYVRTMDRVSLVIGSTLFGHLIASFIVYSHHWRHFALLSAIVLGQYSAKRLGMWR